MKHKSQAVSKSPVRTSIRGDDPRVAKTRTRIDQAFVALLFRRSYRTVRVSDIIRKAGVGRATFYAHYQSKDELLRSQFTRIILPIFKPMPGTPFLLDCRAFFAHVRESPQLFRSLMSGGDGSGSRVVREALEQRLDALLSNQASTADLPVMLAKRFVSSTLITVVSHGLQTSPPESAEEMQRRFEKLVGSGLSAMAFGSTVS